MSADLQGTSIEKAEGVEQIGSSASNLSLPVLPPLTPTSPSFNHFDRLINQATSPSHLGPAS
jgi:hypothetical protein